MIRINVNPHGGDWQSLITYVKARRAELIEEAVDLSATAESRLIASARIAELDDLIAAPSAAVDAARRDMESREPMPGTY